jgi:cobalt-zinc-cadmium efflux system protein
VVFKKSGISSGDVDMQSLRSSETSRYQIHRRLKTALILNTLVIVIEMTGGFYANSLSLLSDAVHNIVDEAALALTFFAYYMATKPASGTKTFGHHKVEALAAWINSAVLALVMLFIMAEAVRRLFYPQNVSGVTIVAVALVASLGNLGVALALRKSAGQNMNIKTAYLHNLGDAAISLSPVVGGLLIATTGWTIADPIIGLFVGVAVLMGTWTVVRESVRVLLDRVPNGIETEKVAQAILATPGVCNVHDLHIWAVDPKLRLLTCQLLVDDMRISESLGLQKTIRALLVQKFGIGHATLQLETSSCRPQVLYCNLVQRHFHQIDMAEDLVNAGSDGGQAATSTKKAFIPGER